MKPKKLIRKQSPETSSFSRLNPKKITGESPRKPQSRLSCKDLERRKENRFFRNLPGSRGKSYQDLSSALKAKMFFLTLDAQPRSFQRKSRFVARDTESAKE